MMSEYSSTVTQILSGKETSTEGNAVHLLKLLKFHWIEQCAGLWANFTNAGIDSLTAVKSTTKCIRILSPGKDSFATSARALYGDN